LRWCSCHALKPPVTSAPAKPPTTAANSGSNRRPRDANVRCERSPRASQRPPRRHRGAQSLTGTTRGSHSHREQLPGWIHAAHFSRASHSKVSAGKTDVSPARCRNPVGERRPGTTLDKMIEMNEDHSSPRARRTAASPG
jgi:hypothetical protein